MKEKGFFAISLCLLLVFMRLAAPLDIKGAEVRLSPHIGNQVSVIPDRTAGSEVLCEFINTMLESKKIEALPFPEPTRVLTDF